MSKKGLLVVSFGTSYLSAQQENIIPVEKTIAGLFPDREMRRAFSSKMIINKLKKRDGILIDSIEGAMDKLVEDGFTDLLIQPTFIIHGFEYDELISKIECYRDKFQELRIGQPLLHGQEDYVALCQAIEQNFDMGNSQEALVFMGHGTEHFANACYPALEHYMHYKGYKNVFIGTVEGYPEIDHVRAQLSAGNYKKVTLAPLMLVAGDHALNDMAGEDDSWKTILEGDGLTVNCILNGLGSYPAIRDIFAAHAANAK